MSIIGGDRLAAVAADGSARPPASSSDEYDEGVTEGRASRASGATALVLGTIVGVGIFNLPTALAGCGPISIVSMALTTVGALALGMLFAALARRMPAEGGPSGSPMSRSLSTRATRSCGRSSSSSPASGWPHFINLSGVKNMGAFQISTTVLKFSALAFVSVVGLFYIDSGNYAPWNVSGESAIDAIGAGMAIALLSYLGIETASVAAAKVRDPDRNVPRATVFTTLVLMTGITAAIPYAFSAAAQIKWRVADQRRVETPRFARDMTVAVLALLFSLLFIWYSRNTSESAWLYWAPYLMAAAAFALGIPVYKASAGGWPPPAT